MFIVNAIHASQSIMSGNSGSSPSHALQLWYIIVNATGEKGNKLRLAVGEDALVFDFLLAAIGANPKLATLPADEIFVYASEAAWNDQQPLDTALSVVGYGQPEKPLYIAMPAKKHPGVAILLLTIGILLTCR
jgi:hypothetical protein